MTQINDMIQFLLTNGAIKLVTKDYDVSCWKDDDSFYKTDDGKFFAFGKEEQVVNHLVKEAGGLDKVTDYK